MMTPPSLSSWNSTCETTRQKNITAKKTAGKNGSYEEAFTELGRGLTIDFDEAITYFFLLSLPLRV